MLKCGSCAALAKAAGVDASTFPFSLLDVGMVSERTVTRAGDRRREAAGFFYFRRLRQRRAPLVSSTRCRSPFTPQPHKKPPIPREANRGDARQGLAMLESLVDAAFSADTRLGTFLRSIATKETAAWDAVPGKLGVFPCAPPTFPTPATTARPARRAPWRVRMRTVEQQLTGMIIAVLYFQALGRPKTAINRGELRGVRAAVRRLLRSGHFRVRQIIGVDFSVVEGVLAKGRSSSHALNLLLRSLAADMLVADIHLGILPLASKHNPADEPSREKRVRKANPRDAPPWARRFVAGDVTDVDTVLHPDPRSQWCCSPRVGGMLATSQVP